MVALKALRGVVGTEVAGDSSILIERGSVVRGQTHAYVLARPHDGLAFAQLAKPLFPVSGSGMGAGMRRITAGLIAITVWIALNSIFGSVDPLLRVLFALIGFSAAWVFLLWNDLVQPGP